MTPAKYIILPWRRTKIKSLSHLPIKEILGYKISPVIFIEDGDVLDLYEDEHPDIVNDVQICANEPFVVANLANIVKEGCWNGASCYFGYGLQMRSAMSRLWIN